MVHVPVRRIDIHSAADARLEPFRDVRDKDLRGRDRLFMAESEMVLRRLLIDPLRIHALLLSASVFERLAPELEVLPETVPVFVARPDLMTAIAGFRIHRGVLAAGVRPVPAALTMEARLGHLRGRDRLRLLVAERLTNVDNIGALFRNAAAFGVDGILLDPECCDPLYRKAIRVSMGHVFAVPWAVATTWPDDLVRLRTDWNVAILGAEVCPRARALPEVAIPDRVAIVLGSEADGIRPETLSLCDEVAMIPMAPGVPSLNVATASAVLLYEAARTGDIRT